MVRGDGSTLMRLGELEAFSRTGAAVPLVIVNDRAYGTIRARQRRVRPHFVARAGCLGDAAR